MEKSKLVSKQTLSTHTVRVALDFVRLFATKTDHTFFSSFYDVHLMSKFFKKNAAFHTPRYRTRCVRAGNVQ